MYNGRVIPPDIPRPVGVQIINPTAIKNPNGHRIPNELLDLMPLTTNDINFIRGKVDYGSDLKSKVNLGDIIALTRPSVEDCGIERVLFRVAGHVGMFNGVPVNSYILKELEEHNNPNRQKITITKQVCNLLGIEFEPGLELWPDTMNFVRLEDIDDDKPKERALDYSNMGTYPASSVDNTIKKICVSINMSAFNISGDGIITAPTGEKFANMAFFVDTMNFKLYAPVLAGFRITNVMPITKAKDNIDNRHLCFELNVDDGNGHGIPPSFVEGMNIDDIVAVTWGRHEMPAQLPPFNSTNQYVRNASEYISRLQAVMM